MQMFWELLEVYVNCPKRVMHLIFDMWTDRRTQAICINLIQIAIKDLCAAIKREMEKIINPGIYSGFPYLGISIFPRLLLKSRCN